MCEFGSRGTVEVVDWVFSGVPFVAPALKPDTGLWVAALAPKTSATAGLDFLAAVLLAKENFARGFSFALKLANELSSPASDCF